MSDRKPLSVFLRSRYSIAALCALAALFSLLILLLLLRSSLPPAAQQKPAPPATVLNGGKESELATIKLTPEAEKRLGIETTAIEFRGVPRTLSVSGEVVIPQGQTIVVSAPMAGTLQTVVPGAGPAVGMLVRKGQPLFRLSPFLAPERDLRVQLERDVATLTERVNAARIRKERAELLAREKAGSVRAAEQAQEEFAIAEAELKAARERLERLAAAPLSSGVAVTITAPIDGSIQRVSATTGQATSGGATLFEIVSLAKVWIRVPVYVGDLNSVARNHGAHIHGLGDDQTSPSRLALPVNAPPSADAAGATADLYYALANGDGSLRPGQRVGVTLALKSQEQSLTLPWSAILHDVQGGTWVYENTAPQTFEARG